MLSSMCRHSDSKNWTKQTKLNLASLHFTSLHLA